MPTEPNPAARMAWERLSCRRVYDTDVGIWVCEDEVRAPNGTTAAYTVLHSTDGVGVLPLDDRQRVTLVGQYRYPHETFSWEIPTGSVGEGEPPEEAARRELREEAHLEAGTLTPLLTYHPNKSLMMETVNLYLGRDLRQGSGERDSTELLEVRPFPFDQVLRMVLDGQITDSVTIIATLLVARQRGQ